MPEGNFSRSLSKHSVATEWRSRPEVCPQRVSSAGPVCLPLSAGPRAELPLAVTGTNGVEVDPLIAFSRRIVRIQLGGDRLPRCAASSISRRSNRDSRRTCGIGSPDRCQGRGVRSRRPETYPGRPTRTSSPRGGPHNFFDFHGGRPPRTRRLGARVEPPARVVWGAAGPWARSRTYAAGGGDRRGHAANMARAKPGGDDARRDPLAGPERGSLTSTATTTSSRL